MFPPDHPDLAVALNNLGNLLTRRGESERAVEVLDDAYSIFVRAVGEDHPHTVGTLWNRERSRGDLGDLEEAAGRIAAEIDRLQTAGTESALALVEEGFPELIEAHFHAGALEPAEEAWRRWGAWTDARGIDPAPGRLGLWRARLLLARDEPATALQEARRALEELDTDAELVPWARCVEGGALERLGRASEARDRLESCRALPAPYVLQLREAEAYLRGEHYPGRPP